MSTVLLIIHLFVTLALIGVVLIQRSEGGGLGIGSSQGMGSFMSGRGTANLLTRATAVLAVMFMGLSLTLALLNRGTSGPTRSILDAPAPNTPAPNTPVSGGFPATPSPTVPSPTGAPPGGSSSAGSSSAGTPPATAPSGPSAPTN